MGRFQIREEDIYAEGEEAAAGELPSSPSQYPHREWDFVASSPEEQGALVPHVPQQDENYHDLPFQNETARNLEPHREQRTVYVVYQRPNTYNNNDGRFNPYDDEDYNHSQQRRCNSCPLWLRITFLAFLCQILWYCFHDGPPAPPFETNVSQQQSTDEDALFQSSPSWDEYLHNHSQDFVRSATALFVDLPLHVISWWSARVHSDVYAIYQDWTAPKPCSPEWNHGRIDENHEKTLQERFSTCFAAQSQEMAFAKFLEAFQAWHWNLETMRQSSRSRTTNPHPLVLLASTLTPGLEPESLGKYLVEKVLYPTCARPPIASLDVRKSMDVPVLRHKLIQMVAPWKGKGGFIHLSSVEELSEESLEWLLTTLTNDNVDDNDDQIWVRSMASRVVFLLSSNNIGRPSLMRHLRQDSGLASLMLDLRHDWEKRGAQWSLGATALPFFPVTEKELQMYISLRLDEVLVDWQIQVMFSEIGETLMPKSGHTLESRTIFVTKNAIQALTSRTIVEYVEWSSNIDGQEVDIVRFSTAGILPVKEKLQWLAARLHGCLEEMKKNEMTTLLMNYEINHFELEQCRSVWASSCVRLCTISLA